MRLGNLMQFNFIPKAVPASMHRPRIGPALFVAAVLAATACYVVPRRLEADFLLAIEDDPSQMQAKAGTQAALESLEIAETPRKMSRVARLAEKEGGKTRAIVKLVGRGAIALTIAVFDLGVWILGALLSLFAFVSSLKSAAERTTWRYLQHRKWRRAARYAALTARPG